MSRRQMSNCHRCGAILRPAADVCATCCAPQTAVAPQPFRTQSREPVVVATPEATEQTGLAAWPFGQPDAEAAAEVASRAVVADVRAELSHYTSQTSTHVLASIPSQREPQPLVEIYSVPSTGPNPFLAAARMLQAREEAAKAEANPA